MTRISTTNSQTVYPQFLIEGASQTLLSSVGHMHAASVYVSADTASRLLPPAEVTKYGRVALVELRGSQGLPMPIVPHHILR